MVDPGDCEEKLSYLNDVSHIFYVERVNRSSTAENCIENGKMLRNVLDAVMPNAPNLQHVCLQTEQKHEMEDIFTYQVQKNENLTWSFHRPVIMFGFSPYSTRNIVVSLCVYATICKHEGLPLKFPGILANWEGFSEAADADMVAEQQICATLEHPGKGQAFACKNGDVFQWKDLWRVLAKQFQVEYVDFVEGVDSLDEMMRDKGTIWDGIVKERKLLPTKLEEIGTWWYVDSVLRCKPGVIEDGSKVKSQVYGFSDSKDTKECFSYWIKRTKTSKIVP